jgi:prepilin signal peptidase PulO-like enzyme (type II secretory pathway)
MWKVTSIASLCLFAQTFAFSPLHQARKIGINFPSAPLETPENPLTATLPSALIPSLAGLSTGLIGCVTKVLAEDDYELAELPPPYIPALFGVVLIAGVGILTASLGDVMTEEASLGMQSGAQAKKEIERSRSSYFKR